MLLLLRIPCLPFGRLFVRLLLLRGVCDDEAASLHDNKKEQQDKFIDLAAAYLLFRASVFEFAQKLRACRCYPKVSRGSPTSRDP